MLARILRAIMLGKQPETPIGLPEETFVFVQQVRKNENGLPISPTGVLLLDEYTWKKLRRYCEERLVSLSDFTDENRRGWSAPKSVSRRFHEALNVLYDANPQLHTDDPNDRSKTVRLRDTNLPSYKEAISEREKARQSNSKIRSAARRHAKKYWETPGAREKKRKDAKSQWEDHSFRDSMQTLRRTRWSDADYHEKMQKPHSGKRIIYHGRLTVATPGNYILERTVPVPEGYYSDYLTKFQDESDVNPYIAFVPIKGAFAMPPIYLKDKDVVIRGELFEDDSFLIASEQRQTVKKLRAYSISTLPIQTTIKERIIRLRKKFNITYNDIANQLHVKLEEVVRYVGEINEQFQQVTGQTERKFLE